ncbi:MAG: hypothetical protein LIO53_02100 [Oscillospiraceae bacterium]|nr:hypothetical protein [Oscillospiraceae bacterium]
MKRYFYETNAGAGVVYVDDNNHAYDFDEFDFQDEINEPLTLAVAKRLDYSACDGCETAEEINYYIGIDRGVFEFDENDYETLIEF